MKKRALITGVTGQDGSYLAELLLDKKYEVYGLVRRSSTPNYWRLEYSLPNPAFHLVEGDITDPYSMYRVLRDCKPNEVYNLAAQSQVGTSFEQPVATMQINGLAPLIMLECILHYNKKIKFYQASTSEMFGKSSDMVFGQGQIENFEQNNYACQSESTKFDPQSPYSIAKLSAHYSVDLYRRSYDMFACCGILMNHESPRRGEYFVTRKITKYLGKLFNYIDSIDRSTFNEQSYKDYIKNNTYKLKLGNINSYRDWGYAEDYVKAMWLMLQQDKPQDYVISTDETHSVEDFLNEAFNYVGLDWRDFVEIDPALYRPAEVDYLRGDSSKARRELGWKPNITFKELVHLMVKADIERERLNGHNNV